MRKFFSFLVSQLKWMWLTKVMDKPIFNKSAHIKLWMWLADNPTCYKLDWPWWKFYSFFDIDIESHCFGCRYVNDKWWYDKNTERRTCSNCPFIVMEDNPKNRDNYFNVGACLGGKFVYWRSLYYYDDMDGRREVAKEIAHLAVKDDVRCI